MRSFPFFMVKSEFGGIILLKYEYKVTYFKMLAQRHSNVLDPNKLNALGAEGWELILIDSGTCVFKRQILQ